MYQLMELRSQCRHARLNTLVHYILLNRLQCLLKTLNALKGISVLTHWTYTLKRHTTLYQIEEDSLTGISHYRIPTQTFLLGRELIFGYMLQQLL